LRLPEFNGLPAVQAQVHQEFSTSSGLEDRRIKVLTSPDPIRVFHRRGRFRSNNASRVLSQ